MSVNLLKNLDYHLVPFDIYTRAVGPSVIMIFGEICAPVIDLDNGPSGGYKCPV